jgi:hypothetical protein
MKIKVRLRVDGKTAAEEEIKIDDHKLYELTEEELERSVEIVVTQWANNKIELDWETDEDWEEADSKE